MSLFGHLLALLRGDGGARAAVAALPPAAPDVQLPFAPPLNRLIRYEYDSREQRIGMEQRTRSAEDVRFLRADDGYLLEWITRAGELSASGPKAATAAPLLAVLNEAVGAAIGQPILYELSPEGELLGLRDAAGWRQWHADTFARMAAMGDRLYAGSPDPAWALRTETLAGMASHYAGQTDAQFVQTMSKMVHMVLHGSPALPPGADFAFEMEQPFNLGDGRLGWDASLRLDVNATGQWARLHFRATADSAMLARHSHELAAGLFADAEAQAVMRQNQPDSIGMSDEGMQLVALPGGLVQRARWRRTIRMPGHRPRVSVREMRRVE